MWEDNSHLHLLLQPNWLHYNHLYVFGKSLHQQEYKVLQKGFEAGLSKQDISNVFADQEALRVANISPLTAIDTFGAHNGKIKADIYDDWPTGVSRWKLKMKHRVIVGRI